MLCTGAELLRAAFDLDLLEDLETLLLQKLGPACVAAYNAYMMCREMPKVGFLAMDARRRAGDPFAC